MNVFITSGTTGMGYELSKLFKRWSPCWYLTQLNRMKILRWFIRGVLIIKQTLQIRRYVKL